MGSKGTPMLDQLRAMFPHINASAPASTAMIRLPGQPDSVRRARMFTRTTLQDWRLPEHFDTVALVVSELVTNALRYGLDALPRHDGGTGERGLPPSAGAETAVELELMRYARRLICAVRDGSEAPPEISTEDGAADPAAESGRGLYLVDCFSDGWGWRPLTGDRRGKVVWAVFQTG